MASEILKHETNQGRRKELYHFRDQQGLEVDFLFPGANGRLWMVECKVSKTVQPAMTGRLQPLCHSIGNQAAVLKGDLAESYCEKTGSTWSVLA